MLQFSFSWDFVNIDSKNNCLKKWTKNFSYNCDVYFSSSTELFVQTKHVHSLTVKYCKCVKSLTDIREVLGDTRWRVEHKSWSAGRTGHRVGRSSASAIADCLWLVPFPAHSYVIICDKLLCSQATKPLVIGLAYRAHTALKLHEALKHTFGECAFSHTYSHLDSYKPNFGLQWQMDLVFQSQGMEGLILISRFTLSGVQQSSVVLAMSSTSTPNFFKFFKSSVTKNLLIQSLCSHQCHTKLSSTLWLRPPMSFQSSDT